jgi:hypothetical protein
MLKSTASLHSFRSALLCERSPDLSFQDFAGIVLGQRVPNDYVLRDLEGGYTLSIEEAA